MWRSCGVASRFDGVGLRATKGSDMFLHTSDRLT